jgi:tetratricopeptide (TPR) repeat protein
VLDVLGDRIGRLEPATRAVVEVAAVLGHADLQICAAVLDRDRSAILGALTSAEQIGLVRHAGSEGFAFDHDLSRQAIVESMPATQRIALYAAIASALAKMSSPARVSAAVAHHAWEARSLDARQAARWCRLAGDDAMDHVAYGAAELQYGRALGLTANPREELDARLRLGRAQHGLGDRERYHATFRSAHELDADLGDAVATATAAIGYVGELTYVLDLDPYAEMIVRRALEGLPDGAEALRIRLEMAALSGRRNRGIVDASEIAAESAAIVARARAIGDPSLLLAASLRNMPDPRELEARRALAAEAVELALLVGSSRERVAALSQRAAVHLESGALDAAASDLDLIEAVSRGADSDSAGTPQRVAVLRAAVALSAGRFDEADAVLRVVRAGERDDFVVYPYQRVTLGVLRGEPARSLGVIPGEAGLGAEARLVELTEHVAIPSPGSSASAIELQLVAARAGLSARRRRVDSGRGPRAARRPRADDRPDPPDGPAHLRPRDPRRRDRRSRPLDRAPPTTARRVTRDLRGPAAAFVRLGAVEGYVGVLAGLAGDHVEGERQLLVAADRNHGAGLAPFEAYAHTDRGQLLERIGRSADAIAAFQHAAAIADRLGCSPSQTPPTRGSPVSGSGDPGPGRPSALLEARPRSPIRVLRDPPDAESTRRPRPHAGQTERPGRSPMIVRQRKRLQRLDHRHP